MKNPEEYEKLAASCVHLAKTATEPRSKLMLLDMAQEWLALAEKVRREAELV